MATRRLAPVQTPEQRIAALEAQVERLTSKREATKNLPSEPHHADGADTPVVWFAKTWGSDPVVMYQYVANHVPGKGWVISHQSKKNYLTWNEVLDFAMLREPNGYVPEFYVANEWLRLDPRA